MALPSPPAQAWRGGEPLPGILCVLADNPGPFTLEGTNTWVVHDSVRRRAVVIDPGPDDERHLAAVRSALQQRDLLVEAVLLTHGHDDHAQGAVRFAGLMAGSSARPACGVPVRALDPRLRWGSQGLAAGDRVSCGDLQLDVLAAPGHTADSLCFLETTQGALFTGDTVLGHGSTVIAHPDGHLGDYLASLERLRVLSRRGAVRMVLPGHGPSLAEPTEVIEGYLQHRLARLAQVRDAVSGGARDAREVVQAVYVGLDPDLLAGAELSVRAQLTYLDQLAQDELTPHEVART